MILKAFRSKLASNTILYGITNALYTGLPLILMPFLVSTLDPENYGLVELFRSITLVLIPILGLSAVQSIGRFYFDLNKNQFKVFVTSIQLFQLLTSLLSVLLISSLSFVIKSYDLILLYLAIIYFFFNQLTESLLIVYRVEERAKNYLFIRIGSVVLEIAVMAILFWILNANDWALRVVPMVISSVGIGVVSFFIFRKEGYAFNFSIDLLKKALKYSTPLVLHMLSGYILNIGDRFFIKSFLEADALGNYAVAYQAGMAINFFYTSFNLAWTPTFFQWMKQKKYNSIARVRKLVYITMIGIGAFIGVLWFFIFPIIDAKNKYNIPIDIVLLILISYIVLSFYKFETNYYLYNKQTKKLSIYTMISAIISIVLNIILIPTFGIKGAAFSTLISFICIYILVLLNKKDVEET